MGSARAGRKTVISIEIKNSEDFMMSLNNALEEKGIKDGAIVSLIGAFDNCVISNMDKSDALKDHLEVYDIPLEVSGCGYIQDGMPHIHVVASSNNGETYAGHLHSAVISNWYVKLFIVEQ
jgi:predicted DNA-binding protein with PD1-like motif